jgi:hypothetical protein
MLTHVSPGAREMARGSHGSHPPEGRAGRTAGSPAPGTPTRHGRPRAPAACPDVSLRHRLVPSPTATAPRSRPRPRHNARPLGVTYAPAPAVDALDILTRTPVARRTSMMALARPQRRDPSFGASDRCSSYTLQLSRTYCPRHVDARHWRHAPTTDLHRREGIRRPSA